MRKGFFLLVLSMTLFSQVAFAHPYINSTSINDANGPVPGIRIFGLENEQTSRDVEIEFLSDQWIVKNFVWMLLGSIAIFIGVFGLGVYREDLPTLKFVRKTNESGL